MSSENEFLMKAYYDGRVPMLTRTNASDWLITAYIYRPKHHSNASEVLDVAVVFNSRNAGGAARGEERGVLNCAALAIESREEDCRTSWGLCSHLLVSSARLHLHKLLSVLVLVVSINLTSAATMSIKIKDWWSSQPRLNNESWLF